MAESIEITCLRTYCCDSMVVTQKGRPDGHESDQDRGLLKTEAHGGDVQNRRMCRLVLTRNQKTVERS